MALHSFVLRFASAVIMLACFTAEPRPAHAQSYPNKTIKLVVPFGPGTANDIIARSREEKVTH